MVFLAIGDVRGPVPLSEIATAEGIPGPFLERILARLRDGGLVKATRGVSGGYELARSASDIVAGDIMMTAGIFKQIDRWKRAHA